MTGVRIGSRSMPRIEREVELTAAAMKKGLKRLAEVIHKLKVPVTKPAPAHVMLERLTQRGLVIHDEDPQRGCRCPHIRQSYLS